MVNDSVREELALKVSAMAKTERIENEKAEIISRAEKAKAEIRFNQYPAMGKTEMPIKTIVQPVKPPVAESLNSAKTSPPISESKPIVNPPRISAQSVDIVQPASAFSLPPSKPPVSEPPKQIVETKPQTAELTVKPTSPTLIEFQNKNAVLPEWRLQLQNSVRRRTGNVQNDAPVSVSATPPQQIVLATNGATAYKAEPIEHAAPAPATAAHSNPTLEKALKRIEESRQKFLTEEETAAKPSPFDAFQTPAQRSYPYIVPNNPPAQDIVSKPITTQKAPALYTTKPKPPVTLTEVKAEKFDTNKLPPLPEKISTNFEESVFEISEPETEIEKSVAPSFQIKAVETVEAEQIEEAVAETSYEEDADDRAPLSLRFNAALFDLIIGSFMSVILLAPFMLSSGNLFTWQGLFAFLATCSIVMFIYLTTTIGTTGKTFGMRLFSLEIIDIEENAYPTFHQAAVNSSLYLISLALGGIGFITLFLNHEKRAAHDLLSGTIVVKEYE